MSIFSKIDHALKDIGHDFEKAAEGALSMAVSMNPMMNFASLLEGGSNGGGSPLGSLGSVAKEGESIASKVLPEAAELLPLLML